MPVPIIARRFGAAPLRDGGNLVSDALSRPIFHLGRLLTRQPALLITRHMRPIDPQVNPSLPCAHARL